MIYQPGRRSLPSLEGRAVNTTITITAEAANRYRVRVTDAATATEHLVILTPDESRRYAPESTPEDLLLRSFEFLLERESKESILPKFALSDIERYFPDFPSAIGRRK
jgi:hypothetical protein